MKLLFDNFDILAESPGGIKKLREMILQFAVQGKLTEDWRRENPNDEPASVLLSKIRVEKERLVKEGKIRKQKSLEPIKEAEIPFKLPKGWVIERFGNVTINRDGDRIPLSREMRLSRQGQFDYYGASGVIDSIDEYIFDKDLLLIGEDGANLINRSTPIAFIAHGRYWVNNHAHVLDANSFELLKYFELYINSIDLKPYITGTAQPKMNQAKMNSICIPLPSLAEQNKIVAKVDSLMTLCDELEKQQKEKALKKLTLNKASLHTLHNSATKQDFNKSWNHITNNFDLLYSTTENVKELKQTILQLAVQGKLVPQDPNDEPASLLLEKIRVEKERLVKEGKIKKQKPLEPIKEDDIPFELPEGWEWTRLIDLVDVGTGSTPTKSNSSYYINGTVPWYTSSATNDLYAKEPGAFITEKALLETNCKIFPKGSLIIALYGQGKTRGQISEIMMSGATNQAIAAMIFYEMAKDTKKYVKYFFRKIYHEIRLLAAGAAQPNLNVGKIKATLIPMPPLAEQKRIVAKVDALMALCDRLGENLSDKEKMSGKMLSAVVSGL